MAWVKSSSSWRIWRNASVLLFCILFIFGNLFIAPTFAASPSNIISYQGRLLNSNRVPLSSSTASIVFELYTASSGGTCVWSNSSSTCASATARTVTLTDGLFSENLGDTSASPAYAAISDAIFGNNSSLYLQVTVNGETLTPRKYISSAPYALNAQLLDGMDADSDGATSAAIVALNSSGNLVITGNPDSGISSSSVYINPASGDVATNDFIFGVAVNSSSRFSVDAEGDTSIAGVLNIGGSIRSATSTADLFDDNSGANTVHIGGVDTDRANVISIATQGTQADTISIGNGGTGTTVAITAGSAWSVSSGGTGTFTDLSCSDCISWSDFVDSATLDASVAVELSDSNFVFNVAGAGNFSLTNAQGSILTVGQTGSVSYRLNGTQNPSFYIIDEGSSGIMSNLQGTGDIVFQDNSETFATFSDTGAYTYALDAVDNPTYTITNSGSGNIITNLASSGDVVFQDNGTTFLTLSDLGAVDADGSLYAGDTTGSDDFIFTSAITTASVFSLTVDSLTSGQGLKVSRSNSVATDFTGTLVDIQQNRVGTSTGTALGVSNFGGGNSSALYIIQDQVVEATTTPTAQAMVIDVNEVASNDEVIIIRSDADNSSASRDTEFRFENDGDFFGDGATYNTGADYAEFFPTIDSALGDYDVVCWSATQANGVERCAAGDTDVVGVISVNPAFVGNNFVGAGGTLEGRAGYAMVGLVGQLDTHVSAENGPISIGDAITTSSTYAGYGVRAVGGTYIIGRALEPLRSGTGTIKVLVQPMWYGGDMLTMDGNAQTFSGNVRISGASATASVSAVDSAGLSFVGSRWSGSEAENVSVTIRNEVLSGGDSRLAFANNDGEDVMTFGSTGDLAIAGNFYPSDRGVLQYGAYVYYDSTGAGYMKTNASGWAARSTGYSESFTSSDALVAGDVVEFADNGSVVRSVGDVYSDRIVGVVADASGFVAGSGAYPVTISGRVTAKVTAENGAIVPGDALTTSSRPGYAMKATDAGEILGYALSSLPAGEGTILVFIRPQYFAGGEGVAVPSESIAVHSQDIEDLNVSGVLSMNGGDIVSVGTLSGIGTWEIRENGDIVTNGQLTQIVESLQNTRVSTYATTSTEIVVQLSGTATLHNGVARIVFEQEDSNFNDIISPEDAYRVLVTPDGVTGQLYVTDRTNHGFMIRDALGSEGVSVDWLVLAYRYDLVPERAHETSDVSDEEIVDEENVGGDLLDFSDTGELSSDNNSEEHEGDEGEESGGSFEDVVVESQNFEGQPEQDVGLAEDPLLLEGMLEESSQVMPDVVVEPQPFE